MNWKIPPKIKIYEALGALGDNRVQLRGRVGTVYSSDHKKQYEVRYDPELKFIMSNDNGSYWQGYLGYPAIAFLMRRGTVSFNRKWADALIDINWKELNAGFKNDYDKTIKWIHKKMRAEGFLVDELEKEIDNIEGQLKSLKLKYSGKRQKPSG